MSTTTPVASTARSRRRDGAGVGNGVSGVSDGLGVGAAVVGRLVGKDDGGCVGSTVGTRDGAELAGDGRVDGVGVGFTLGAEDGAGEGADDGPGVGARVGANVETVALCNSTALMLSCRRPALGGRTDKRMRIFGERFVCVPAHLNWMIFASSAPDDTASEMISSTCATMDKSSRPRSFRLPLIANR